MRRESRAYVSAIPDGDGTKNGKKKFISPLIRGHNGSRRRVIPRSRDGEYKREDGIHSLRYFGRGTSFLSSIARRHRNRRSEKNTIDTRLGLFTRTVRQTAYRPTTAFPSISNFMRSLSRGGETILSAFAAFTANPLYTHARPSNFATRRRAIYISNSNERRMKQNV